MSEPRSSTRAKLPYPMPRPERLCDLSTMTPGELLESDLTDHAEFVGTNDRLSADECAEIQTREVLSASWAQRRVRDVARRMLDGTKPIVASQSPNLGTGERRTQRRGATHPRRLWATQDSASREPAGVEGAVARWHCPAPAAIHPSTAGGVGGCLPSIRSCTSRRRSTTPCRIATAKLGFSIRNGSK